MTDDRSCVRCDNSTPDVTLRLLWRARTTSALLCDDCNSYVQGPDHVSIDGNRVTYVIRVDPDGTVTECDGSDLLTIALDWFHGAGTGLVDIVSMPTPAGAPAEFPQTGEHLVAAVAEWGSVEGAAVNPKVWGLYGRSPILGTAFVANDPYDDDGSRHPLPAEFVTVMRSDWVKPPLLNVTAMRHIARDHTWPT